MTYTDYKKYLSYADSIPSMGGRQIREHISEAVKNIKPNRTIVELGTWLGAATAQIALALMVYEKDNMIYTYDKFIAKGRQIEKAQAQGWELVEGEDYLQLVIDALSVFNCRITYVKGSISSNRYTGGKIGLYIDDAAKQKKNFDYCIREFSPHFIPGETICIFMDYYLWQNTGDMNHKYQFNFMQEHKDNFQHLKDIDTSYQDKKEYGAVFKYLGGLN